MYVRTKSNDGQTCFREIRRAYFSVYTCQFYSEAFKPEISIFLALTRKSRHFRLRSETTPLSENRAGPLVRTCFCRGYGRFLGTTMSGHGHNHGRGHMCGCEGEHEPAERGLEYGLYRRIDLEKLQCLNESRDGDGKLVFKPWDQRKDRDKVTVGQSLSPGHRRDTTRLLPVRACGAYIVPLCC